MLYIMLLRVLQAYFIGYCLLAGLQNYNIMYYLSLMPWHGGFFLLLNSNKQSSNQTQCPSSLT